MRYITLRPSVAAKPQPKQTTTTTELIMSLTLDRKVATGLLSKATTGNDLLSVLEMITATFTQPTTAVPTLGCGLATAEEIEF
jgi:hypothetical protein